MTATPDARRHAPATTRNREPIFAVLARVLPRRGWVLEIASGTGEHAAWFAPRLAPLAWQPSDVDPEMLASIAAHAAASGAANLRLPVRVDVTDHDWPATFRSGEPPVAVVCCNMIHIAPWRAAKGLVAGAAALLTEGGLLYLYGPYSIGGQHTAPSNEAFDRSLRSQDTAWGVRDLDDVVALADRHALDFEERVGMPADNQSLLFRRRAARLVEE